MLTVGGESTVMFITLDVAVKPLEPVAQAVRL